MRGHLIIIGASARAAAQSAIRAGYQPWCIDLFADRDLQAIAPVKRCSREQWPQGVMELMKDAPPGPVLLTGAMENHLEVVRALAASRQMLGPSVAAMERVRQSQMMKHAFVAAFDRELADIPMEFSERDWMPGVCRTWNHVPWHAHVSWMLRSWFGGQRVLIKPLRGAGGRGIRFWSAGTRVTEEEYLQQHVRGTSISAVYLGRGDDAVMLGATEQIIGDGAFGADGFTFVGNIGPLSLPWRSLYQMRFAGDAMAHAAKIEGIFGIDAVLSTDGACVQPEDPTAYPVEVNPRYTSSVELIEAASGENVLALDTTQSRSYPLEPLHATIRGKAIVYARQSIIAGDLLEHLEPEEIADIPQVGERIEKGQPICTVFAEAATRDACLAGLRDKASTIYTRLKPR